MYKPIGGVNGVNGSDFANEMMYLQNVCDKIKVRYNSEGGSVLDGYSIYSSVVNSTVPTESYIDGLAASTAGWCALAANKVYISDMGTLMVHGASGKPAEMVDLANGSIAKMLQNRSGMTIEETTDLMGKETFYKAFNESDRKFLLDKKIVDEVFTTGKKANIKNSDSLSTMANVYNSLLNQTKNMSNINNILNISVNADETEQVAKINEIKNTLSTTEAENVALKAENETLKAEKTAKEEADKATLKTEVTNFVTLANKSGKIKNELVNSTIEKASESRESFDFIKNMIGDLPSNKSAQKIFDPSKIKNEGGTEKTYAELEKESPEVLVELYNNNREKYNELLNAYKNN